MITNSHILPALTLSEFNTKYPEKKFGHCLVRPTYFLRGEKKVFTGWQFHLFHSIESDKLNDANTMRQDLQDARDYVQSLC